MSNAAPSAFQKASDLGKCRTAAWLKNSNCCVSATCCAAPRAGLITLESPSLDESVLTTSATPSTIDTFQKASDLRKCRTAAWLKNSNCCVSATCCAAPRAGLITLESPSLDESFLTTSTKPSSTQRHSSPSMQTRDRKSDAR